MNEGEIEHALSKGDGIMLGQGSLGLSSIENSQEKKEAKLISGSGLAVYNRQIIKYKREEVTGNISANSATSKEVLANNRPHVQGKFIFAGEEKLYLRGVTYGTFKPNGESEYDAERVELDFALMAANGINTIRVYTVPPRRLLDAAARYGLRVMVGLPWEQHIAFLDDSKTVQSIESRVQEAVRACADHPAVLCYAIGNEIPAPVVRWYGAKRVEKFWGDFIRS